MGVRGEFSRQMGLIRLGNRFDSGSGNYGNQTDFPNERNGLVTTDIWTPQFKVEMHNRYMSMAVTAAANFVYANATQLPEMFMAGGSFYAEVRWSTGAQFIEEFRALTNLFTDETEDAQIIAAGDNIEFVKTFTRANATGEISADFTVRVLLGYDANYSDISGVSESVKLGAAQYVREGRKITAIKYIRERTGMGLRDAKTVADSLADDPAYMAAPDDNADDERCTCDLCTANRNAPF